MKWRNISSSITWARNERIISVNQFQSISVEVAYKKVFGKHQSFTLFKSKSLIMFNMTQIPIWQRKEGSLEQNMINESQSMGDFDFISTIKE